MRLDGSKSIVLSVLVVHGALLSYISWSSSPVFHEPAQLIAGIAGWQLGRFHIYNVNPPLVRSVASLPVLLLSPVSDPKKYDRPLNGREEYVMAAEFLTNNRVHTHRLFVVARWTCILFSLVGAYFCWRFATALYGSCSGLVALVLWCFSPYVLGHGATIMPDVPSAAIGVTAIYFFWRWLQKPRWKEAMVAGGVLGMAELCKFTLLVFYPLLPVLWLVYRLPERKTLNRRHWLQQTGMLATVLVVSVYVINCGYLFEGTFKRLGEFRFQTMMLTGCETLKEVPLEGANRFAGTWLGPLPVPFPATLLLGLDALRYDFERGMASYLRGEWAERGWWYYYLLALAWKVPLGTLCLALLAVVVTILDKHYSASWRDEAIVLVPALTILVFVSSQTGVSVHSRYAIPVLPFLFIWISKVARAFQWQSFTQRRFLIALMAAIALVWSVSSSLYIYPHSMSYFNELVGGPKHGAKHLLDSNIDWGQDLLYMKDWLDHNPDVKLDGLALSEGSYSAALAGILETRQPPSIPKPGWYALSVNYLYSRGQRYRYFLRDKPAAMAGYSICIYHITRGEADLLRQDLPELASVNVATPSEPSGRN